MFKVGNELIVDALREVKPDVVCVLPGFPLNPAQNAIIGGALGEIPVVNVSNESDAIGIVIGAGQAGKVGCAVIKDKGVSVAFQLITEELSTPGVIIVGLDVDGRGSYCSSAMLPEILEKAGVLNFVPMNQREIPEKIKEAFAKSRESYRLAAVYITEDLAMQGVSDPAMKSIGEYSIAPGDPDPAMIEEAVQILRSCKLAAIVVGKGALGERNVKRDLPAWPSAFGDDATFEILELKKILEKKYSVKTELYSTRHAAEFPQTRGMKPTGINSGVFVDTEVLVMVGMSYDMFAVKFRAECVISINVDPLAVSIVMADIPVVGGAKRSLQRILLKLQEVDEI